MKTQRYGNRARKARIALEDGIIFGGLSFGATGERYGEVVFNTSMAGYQEILTDPSYKGQIVTIKISLVLTSENGIILLIEGLC